MSGTPGSEPRLPHVVQFEGLRGLLALWVAVTHILCWCGFAETPAGVPGRVWQSWVLAQPAVETFIILSGFAISFLLHDRRPTYRAFMAGRFFRIVPVYLACLVLGLGTVFLTPSVLSTPVWKGTEYFWWVGNTSREETARLPEHLLAHLTLLYGVIPKHLLPECSVAVLTPAWSITLEWQYYLFAPLIARRARSGAGLLGLAAVAVVGLRYGDYWASPNLAFLPAQLPLFLIGVGSYHFYAHLCGVPGRAPGLASAAAAALVFAAVVSSWHPVALGIWAVAFGSVFARGRDPFARLLAVPGRVLSRPLLRRLGAVSYPLYLVHWPVIIALLYLLLHFWPTVSSGTAVVLMLGLGTPVILGAAVLLHRLVEAPGMALGKNWASRRASAMTIP